MNDYVDEAFNSGAEIPALLKATGKTIKVIFDNEAATEMGQYFETEAGKPIATCRTVDVENYKNELPIVINNVEYKIKNRKHDGTGLTFLILAKF